MDGPNQPAIHYHIRWLPSGRLDWEKFGTRGEAEAQARELARTNEIYNVVEFDQSCKQCKSMVAASLRSRCSPPNPRP